MRVGVDQSSSARPCCCSSVTAWVSVSGTLAALRFRLPYVPAKAESPDGWARITTSKLSPGPLRACSLEASESRDFTRSPAEPSRPAASLATVSPSLSWCAPEVRALFSSPLSICWTRKNPRTVTTTTEITRVVATTRSWSERCQRRRICPATTRARRPSARRNAAHPRWQPPARPPDEGCRGGKHQVTDPGPGREVRRRCRWRRSRAGSILPGVSPAGVGPVSGGLPPGSPLPRGPRPASLLLAAPSIALLHADRVLPGPADPL